MHTIRIDADSNGGFVIFGARRWLATGEWGWLGYAYPAPNESPGELGPSCYATICSGDCNNDAVVDG